ncbi:hypothetical protein PTTG_29637 [Puccinia triticina 1-1 BBBD Race 1]|uniref:Uncharacterized protein n=1 Tax=Puccinia triticina (isolate 1-1 / race 1 (BBBD)) TaxID=630390 RepID=A0A180G533_PUCT1|nr:hypothetical protein PTTG_29637 [Puccinia triticina 1-1 BBBD Race 1]
MSGLNISDATNSVKAASQQTAPEAAHTDESQQATSSQAPVPNPKPPKATKAVKTTKPTTRAAAKSNATTPRVEPTSGEPPKGPLHDPEIAEILSPVCEPVGTEKETGPVEVKGESKATADREARAILMAKMVQAEKAGDNAKVKRYMKMYEAVLADQTPAAQKTAVKCLEPVITQPQIVPQKRPAHPGETTQVQNVKFITGRSNSHDDGGFPPYFHKLLLKCKGPLPLTIFNREWQEKALAEHSKNRPKIEETASEKGLRYHGFPVPDEFSQNFSDWTLNHRCFHLTMKDRYHYPVLADWILAHKDHCDRLHQKRGFMVALRHDIRIRNNAFAFRVEENGEESFSDISQFKQETADEAIATCRDFNEIGLQENPYAIRRRPAKSNKSNAPANPNPPKTKPNQKGPTEESSSTTQGHSSLPPKPDQGRGPPGSGYKGNHFNPNHTGGSVRNRKPRPTP